MINKSIKSLTPNSSKWRVAKFSFFYTYISYKQIRRQVLHFIYVCFEWMIKFHILKTDQPTLYWYCKEKINVDKLGVSRR